MVAIASRPRVLAAAFAVAALTAAAAPAGAQRVGVNSAVNPDATGIPPGATERKLVLGQEVVFNERIATGPAGQTQVLFLDESAMTVGPNADVTIDQFVYDPNSTQGRLAMSATRGVMRFVGGKLSKEENAVSLRTPLGTIGIRGGVFLLNLTGTHLDVVFLYGKGLTVTAANVSQTITRPSFYVTIPGRGAPPSAPAAAPAGTLSTLLGELSGHSGATGGSSNPPSDAGVASSGIASVISANVAASVQQAVQNAQITQLPQYSPNTATTGVNLSTVSNQKTVADVSSGPQGPQPVAIQIAGLVKVAPPGSNLGFTDQSAQGRIPYTGTITYPAGAGQTNGVAAGNTAGGQVFSLSPLTAGATTTVTGTANPGGTASGTATETADGDFFYSNLTTSSNERVFVFGGAPVSQSFYTTTSPTPQFYAFSIQPDASLGTATQPQTIPFLASNVGGTMPNATVSPLYVVNPANTRFASVNVNNSNLPTVALQSSLAINGTGANQSAALVVGTGTFITSGDSGNPAFAASVRGAVQASGTAPITHIVSGAAAVPDGNNNNLFGGTSISGFVIDQNTYTITNDNLNLQLATAVSNSPSSVINYAFTQPAVAAALPSGVGVNRSALDEQVFFGGTMQYGGAVQAPNRYALIGTGALLTDPTSGRVAAVFGGIDPFTASQSGIRSANLAFGSLPGEGRNLSRSAFIDNNLYAALESPSNPSQINGQNLPTLVQTGSSSGTPQLAMVTSGVVNNVAPPLPAGVSFCQCQFLQWGYWTGTVPVPGLGPNGNPRTDFASINPWLAGQPTVNMPTSGVGTYTGAAVATINNGGASYLAAGGFTNVYNFGNFVGNVTISNLDGRTYSGNVSGSNGSPVYGGTLVGTGTNSNLSGLAIGSFFGPGAPETGGSFAIHNNVGPNYLASGIFAGHR
ncbi:MAG TPA: FecR domain-containing protein [Stellaceae bacterium]|nr:FecR domain-containing protein [Stellaceae bacterium]